jgi:hypothetical protein
MKGLILKDFLVLKKSFRIFAIILFAYVIMAAIGLLDSNIIIVMIIVLMLTLPISSFAYDEQSNWIRYAMSMPAGRRNVVKARYLSCVIVLLIGAAVALGAGLAAGAGNKDKQMESLIMVAAGLTVGLLYMDINLVLNYKLGVEKARIWFYVLIMTPALLVGLIARFGFSGEEEMDAWFSSAASALNPAVLAFIPLIALAGFYLSYRVSLGIVNKKDY